MARKAKATMSREGMITCAQELSAPTPRANTWRQDAEDYLTRMGQGRPDLAGDPLEVIQGLMLAIETAEAVLHEDGHHSLTIDDLDQLLAKHATECVVNESAVAKAEDLMREAQSARDNIATAARTEVERWSREAHDLDKALSLARVNHKTACEALAREQHERRVDVAAWRETSKAMQEQRDEAREALASDTVRMSAAAITGASLAMDPVAMSDLGARLAEIRSTLESAQDDVRALRENLAKARA
jgi:chromosome segregation ATPase